VFTPRHLLLLLFCWAGAPAILAVEIGDSREAVLKELGYPLSTASRGGREILLYPKGGRVELADGKVADIRGPLPIGTAVAKPTPAPATPSQPPATVPRKTTSRPDSPAPATVPSTKREPASPASDSLPPPKSAPIAYNVPALGVGLLLRFGLTILGLKIAFKFWATRVRWKGVLLVASIDIVLHVIFELLGPFTDGVTTLDAFENGIPGFVMVYTVNRFCFNKRLQNAVVTAIAVKISVTLVYLFLIVALLRKAFG
jgi:hypothetical protein